RRRGDIAGTAGAKWAGRRRLDRRCFPRSHDGAGDIHTGGDVALRRWHWPGGDVIEGLRPLVVRGRTTGVAGYVIVDEPPARGCEGGHVLLTSRVSRWRP